MTRFFAGFAVAYVLAGFYWGVLLNAAGTKAGRPLALSEIALVVASWPVTLAIAYHRTDFLISSKEAADANR